jgi:hypothetical protein
VIKQMNNLKATWNILTCASKISQLIEIFMESHCHYASCRTWSERKKRKKQKNVEERKNRCE